MKTHVIQSNFLSGVLDPRASARVDTDAYNQGLFTGKNVTPSHLGGVRRRPGLRFIQQLPGVLSRIVSTITNPPPNGGTAANGNDNDESTLLTTNVAVGTTTPYVVADYDLGSAQSIRFADVRNIFSTSGTSAEFWVQYSTNAVDWVFFGLALDLVDTIPRTYRRSESAAVSAQYWRLAKVGGTDMGGAFISVGEFNLQVDTAAVSEARLIAFEVSASRRFVVALTDGGASIYEGSTLVASVPLPYVSADLAAIDATAVTDTMVLVHEDYPPRFLFVEGDDYNFQTEEIVFDAVPTADFDDAASPTPVSDVQVITFASGWVQGNTFQVELEGAKTAAVTYAGDATAAEQSATAANIAREVQKLHTVEGFTGVTCARTGVRQYTVTLADASAKNYELMSVVPLSSSAAATVAKSANGTPRTEPVWSATRGYPRTVEFFEGRLYFGGTRSRQSSVLASEVGNTLNFELDEGLDDEPMFTTLGGRAGPINGLFAGRSMQVFTTSGELRYAKQQGVPIVPGDAPSNQTAYGAAKIRPVNTDGATLFVQLLGKSIRDFRFIFEEEAYDSVGVSSLAPHLIYAVKDLTAWKGSATDEINLVFVVNGINPSTDDDALPDATVAVLNSRKEAAVQAWTHWETQGSFKAAATVLQDRYFAVLRNINGTNKVFLEILDDAHFTDCSKKQTFVDATVITGLSHLNGEECRVRADEFVLESNTPSGGQITIERASDDVEVGLNFDTEVTPMPLNTMVPPGPTPNFMRKRRVVKVRIKVRNTNGLRLNGRPIADRNLDISNLDEPAAPITGNFELEETTNWDQKDDKFVVFSQVDPLPMELLGIDVHLESNE